MNIFTLLAILVFLFGIVALGIALLVRSARTSTIRPCYRCGIVSTTEFMNIRYCGMCRTVVARMLPVVYHDPPYGFPGGPGYLDFREEEKEVKHG